MTKRLVALFWLLYVLTSCAPAEVTHIDDPGGQISFVPGWAPEGEDLFYVALLVPAPDGAIRTALEADDGALRYRVELETFGPRSFSVGRIRFLEEYRGWCLRLCSPAARFFTTDHTDRCARAPIGCAANSWFPA